MGGRRGRDQDLAHDEHETSCYPRSAAEVLNEDQLRRLLKTCEGNDLESRRETATIRLLLDTGMRRQEIANLKVEDVDFDYNIAFRRRQGQPPACLPLQAQDRPGAGPLPAGADAAP